MVGGKEPIHQSINSAPVEVLAKKQKKKKKKNSSAAGDVGQEGQSSDVTKMATRGSEAQTEKQMQNEAVEAKPPDPRVTGMEIREYTTN